MDPHIGIFSLINHIFVTESIKEPTFSTNSPHLALLQQLSLTTLKFYKFVTP